MGGFAVTRKFWLWASVAAVVALGLFLILRTRPQDRSTNKDTATVVNTAIPDGEEPAVTVAVPTAEVDTDADLRKFYPHPEKVRKFSAEEIADMKGAWPENEIERLMALAAEEDPRYATAWLVWKYRKSEIHRRNPAFVLDEVDLDELEKQDPQNALPNYVWAADMLNNGYADQALAEIEKGIGKNYVRTYGELYAGTFCAVVDAGQDGKSVLHKVIMVASMPMPELVALLKCSEFLIEQSRKATDRQEGIRLAGMALKIARQFEGQKPVSLIDSTIQVGLTKRALEQLAALDPAYAEDLARTKKANDDMNTFLVGTADMPPLMMYMASGFYERDPNAATDSGRALLKQVGEILDSSDYQSFMNAFHNRTVLEGEVAARAWAVKAVNPEWWAVARELNVMQWLREEQSPGGSSESKNTLKMWHIGLALREYARAHDGKFPAKLSDLQPYLATEGPSVFSAPDARTPIRDWADVDARSDFVYVPGLTMKDMWRVILYERVFSNDNQKRAMSVGLYIRTVAEDQPRDLPVPIPPF